MLNPLKAVQCVVLVLTSNVKEQKFKERLLNTFKTAKHYRFPLAAFRYRFESSLIEECTPKVQGVN